MERAPAQPGVAVRSAERWAGGPNASADRPPILRARACVRGCPRACAFEGGVAGDTTVIQARGDRRVVVATMARESAEARGGRAARAARRTWLQRRLRLEVGREVSLALFRLRLWRSPARDACDPCSSARSPPEVLEKYSKRLTFGRGAMSASAGVEQLLGGGDMEPAPLGRYGDAWWNLGTSRAVLRHSAFRRFQI